LDDLQQQGTTVSITTHDLVAGTVWAFQLAAQRKHVYALCRAQTGPAALYLSPRALKFIAAVDLLATKLPNDAQDDAQEYLAKVQAASDDDAPTLAMASLQVVDIRDVNNKLRDVTNGANDIFKLLVCAAAAAPGRFLAVRLWRNGRSAFYPIPHDLHYVHNGARTSARITETRYPLVLLRSE
jgi:hypothetical protein